MPEQRGLSADAYVPLPEGQSYRPFVGAEENLAEFTLKAVLLGILFGIVFGAANAYLGLRAGLTISTSIPVAVMTVAAFRALRGIGHGGTILEANMSQTIGSASSSLASGVIFTLPALFLWGLSPNLLQMTVLAMSGGLIGILFMIPLRRFLIQREHGRLPYPEGTACAQVLVASEVGGSRARHVIEGLLAGAGFKFLTAWLKVIPDHLGAKVPFLRKGEIGMDLSPALFGVGYILGPKVAAIMVGGGLLSWLVIIPLIDLWGASLSAPMFPETQQLIGEMSPSRIWTRYVRYIGAGAVATAGIITLVRSLPVMVESFRIGAGELKGRVGANGAASARTSADLPLRYVGIGVGIIILALALNPWGFETLTSVGVRLVAAICVAVFAFFFVTVAARIVGMVGVTSNPTSGMTIAALLGTSTVFLLMGWTDLAGKAGALTVGCVVAIAVSIAGDTSQDLKTGFLLGATPRRQQIGELIGVLTSATFVCLSVLLLAKVFGFGSQELPAPQATLMKLVIDGVIDQSLPWNLVILGATIAIACEFLKIPSLPFAVGVYLPVSTMTPVFVGGLIRWWMESRSANEEQRQARRERGILLGSGFVGGEGLLGVAIAAVTLASGSRPGGIGMAWAGGPAMEAALGLLAFGLLGTWFFRIARGRGHD